MVVDGDALLVARDGQVACLSLEGQPIWTQPLAGKDRAIPMTLGFPGNVRQGDDVSGIDPLLP